MGRVLTITVSVVLLAAGGVANAQVPRGLERSGANAEASASRQSIDVVSANRFQTGVEALQAKNFQVAEGIFEDVLRQNPNHPEGNLMMGTAKMSLGKWEEAKKYLEIATRKDKKNPDPKSRLAVTLIKLGDMEGAMQQRAELEKMSKDCKGKCRNAEWIAAGLAMVEGAMPPKQP
jgi:Tfp pilus assembly protein PilF